MEAILKKKCSRSSVGLYRMIYILFCSLLMFNIVTVHVYCVVIAFGIHVYRALLFSLPRKTLL